MIIKEIPIIRNSKLEKETAADYIINKMQNFGFDLHVEEGKDKNILSNDIKNKEIIFTAHYDTPNSSRGLSKKIFSTNIPQIIMFIIFIFLILKGDFFGINFERSLFYNITFNLILFMFYYVFLKIFFFVAKLLMKIWPVSKLFKPNKVNFNDNTSGVVSLLTIASELSNKNCNYADKVGFVFFDNEEKGLLGSNSFKKRYKKKLKANLFINLDCVGTKDAVDLLVAVYRNNVSGKYIDNALTVFTKDSENVVFKIRSKFIKKFLLRVCLFFNTSGCSDYVNLRNYNVIHIGRYKKSFYKFHYIPFVHTNNDTLENIDESQIERISLLSVEVLNHYFKH